MAGLYFIPGIQEAEQQFTNEQLESFAGVEPDICGAFKVEPFTAQMFIELVGSENAFFVEDKLIGPEDVANFLWRVSPGFNRKGKNRSTYNLCIAAFNFYEIRKEILLYIARAWHASPQWPGAGKGSPSAGVWPSRIVDLFASEYGWTEEYVLNMPFRRLWQYANRILERNDPKYTHKCPESLRLRQKWLDEQNSQTGRS